MTRRLMIVLLTSAPVFTAAQEKENDSVRSMCFTVEVRASSSDSSQIQTAGTFSTETWNALWDELGVTGDQWRDWQVLVQSSQQHVSIVADMPELSRLAYIDEGAVHFKPEGLRADALAALSRTTSPETRALLDSVVLAAEIATAQPGADVVVHPFGACESNASNNDASHRLI